MTGETIWMTAQEAADHFGVALKSIYRWTYEGRLVAGGLDHRGQKVFRHLDVARAEKATRAKAKRVLVPAA
ncbi:helix-turn-helix domain-containing protein [Streptomyces sp. NPDC056661]|uniref:helix-turn-helix domain-containing protein n=1 Tax=Streptomyces sp. NPDC056661 TaxID=3345898 RepID=UPI0036BC254A